jgi:hypothetical protein
MKRFHIILLSLILVVVSGCSNAITDTKAPSAGSKDDGYSREYLASIMADIDKYFVGFEDPESLGNDKLGQIFVSTDIMDGYIEVTLTELNEENIALFKKQISDSDAIVFKQGKRFEYLST